MADEKRRLILDLLAKSSTKKGTDEAANDLDKLGRAAEDADKKTEHLGKTSEKTGSQVDKMGHDLDGTRNRVSGLTKEIEIINRELATLHNAFADASDAGDRLDISKAIRRTENDLRRVTKNRNFLDELLPDPTPHVKSWGNQLIGGIQGIMSTAAQSVASNPLLIAGVGAAVALATPQIAGGIAAAVVGGAGVGGILGGLAIAAKSDTQVQQYAANIGDSFTKGIQLRAKDAFSGSLMTSLEKVEALAGKAVEKIGHAFQTLAPYVDPFVDSILRAAEVVGGSLLGAAEKSGPVIEALGRFAEGAAEDLAGFFDMIASHSDEAASFIDALGTAFSATMTVIGFVTDQILNFVAALNAVDEAIQDGAHWLEDHVSWLDLTNDGYEKGSEAARLFREGIIDGADDVNNYDHYLQGAAESTTYLKDAHLTAAQAAEQQRKAEEALTNQLRAETDPAFALLGALEGLRKAQREAAEATRKHGADSNEARVATRKLAEAAIALQSAAGAAGGSLDGRLSPSLRAALSAAKLTKSQMAAVERELRAARQAAEAYAKDYKATITTLYVRAYQEKGAGKSRYPDERAAGGPIVRGKPYLVGENGPEIVVPDSSGRVLNSSASRGLMVQAGMTGVQGSVAAASYGGGPSKAIVEVAGGADIGVASLINYLIRTDKIQIQVVAA